MRILLDTSWLYDLMEAPGKLLASERRFFESGETEIFVSAVSIWEMRLKHDARHRSGERKSPFDPNDVIAVLAGQIKTPRKTRSPGAAGIGKRIVAESMVQCGKVGRSLKLRFDVVKRAPRPRVVR